MEHDHKDIAMLDDLIELAVTIGLGFDDANTQGALVTKRNEVLARIFDLRSRLAIAIAERP